MTVKLNMDTSSGAIITSDTSGILDIQSAGTTKMTVGTTIDIQGNELVLDADADTSIHADTDDQIDFKTGGTDRMQLDSAGRLRFNTSNAKAKATFGHAGATDFGIALENSDSGSASQISIRFQRNTNTDVGSITTTNSATAFNTSSDYRLKENVNYTFDATTRLKQLKPARFNFIADESNTLIDGFIAHEVSSIVPEAITGTKDAVDDNGDAVYQGIDQSKLVPLLVKTIQELEARITALES